jgi:hypothetical protein
MDRRKELADINANVMPIKAHKWVGDVLVAQSADDNGWATFNTRDGSSMAHANKREAVAYAKQLSKSQTNPYWG